MFLGIFPIACMRKKINKYEYMYFFGHFPVVGNKGKKIINKIFEKIKSNKI